MNTNLLESLLARLDGSIPPEVDERVEAVSAHTNEFGYDDWGYSKHWMKRVVTLSWKLYRDYFRIRATGLERVPAGRAMLIGNHSSQMAYDGLMMITALLMEANPPRALKAMIEHFFLTQPLYAQLMPRIGQITGTPENCLRLLAEDQAVLVFPEGGKGGGKVIFDRYKLFDFGHGFMRLAMKAGAPVVPFAFIGGEEMVPSFSPMTPLAKALGVPYLPLSPTLIFPLPTRCSILVGEPLRFEGDPADAALVARNVAAVMDAVRALMDRGLAERTSIF